MSKDSKGRERHPNQDLGRAGLAAGGDGRICASPDYLERFGEEAWKKSVRYLSERGLLDSSDSFLVELFATSYADFRQCRELVEVEGYTLIEGADDRMTRKRNPSLISMENAWGRCLKILTEMGFTPRARRSLGGGEGETDKLMDFLNG